MLVFDPHGLLIAIKCFQFVCLLVIPHTWLNYTSMFLRKIITIITNYVPLILLDIFSVSYIK